MRPALADWRTRHTGRMAATILAAVTALTAMAIAGCGTRIGGTPIRPDASGANAAAAAPSSRAAHAQGSGQPASAAQLSQPPVSAGEVGTLAQVPWADIGPGWALAEYTTGSRQVAGPVTLYLLDPEGGMYEVYRWPSTTQPWVLVAWSGDKSRALFEQVATSQPTLHQVTLATGQISTFTLPSPVTAVLGYTRPDGDNILVAAGGVARYSLTGAFQAQLSTSGELASAVSSIDGLTEVVNAGTGVELVGNAGGAIRFLPVPGTSATMGGCTPVRWWNATDVLVACTPTQAIGPRLWLVPVSGAVPTALTPARTGDGPDFGDADAWQLPTGLYLQAEAGCGPPFLAREGADGAVQAITVPGSSGTVVVATSGDRMLVQEFTECLEGSSLGWLDPATGSVQQVLTEQPSSTGVVAAVPFDGDGQQPPPQT
jgi:hypothetical protein